MNVMNMDRSQGSTSSYHQRQQAPIEDADYLNMIVDRSQTSRADSFLEEYEKQTGGGAYQYQAAGMMNMPLQLMSRQEGRDSSTKQSLRRSSKAQPPGHQRGSMLREGSSERQRRSSR